MRRRNLYPDLFTVGIEGWVDAWVEGLGLVRRRNLYPDLFTVREGWVDAGSRDGDWCHVGTSTQTCSRYGRVG